MEVGDQRSEVTHALRVLQSRTCECEDLRARAGCAGGNRNTAVFLLYKRRENSITSPLAPGISNYQHVTGQSGGFLAEGTVVKKENDNA